MQSEYKICQKNIDTQFKTIEITSDELESLCHTIENSIYSF